MTLLYLATFVSVTYGQELQMSGILSKAINHWTLIIHQPHKRSVSY